MSYYRSYFSKNNTILKNSFVNTSKSPTTEIYYGDGHSKFIFQVDLTDLRNKLINDDLVVDGNTKHYLRMTNTIFGSESFVGQENTTGGLRATSFDLILLPLNEFWDEGVGFDYTYIDDISISYDDNKTYDIRPSNWYYRTTIDKWNSEGIFNEIPTGVNIKKIHFDNGNENINADITDYINSILLSGSTNYGMALFFDFSYFEKNDLKESVSFFTKYTQTFYEPYVESVFDDVIMDNRNDFTLEMPQNLYLYVKNNGNFVDLDIMPTVSILDSSNNIINESLNDLIVSKVKKGVYKITFGLSGTICNNKQFFYDKWSNIIFNGAPLSDIKQRFIPKLLNETLSIGGSDYSYEKLGLKYFGIKSNEKIKRGEIRNIIVELKSYYTNKIVISDQIYYRIYVTEGKTQVNVFDWTKLDKTSINSFTLDTSYLIPREYHVEIKTKINNEELFYSNQIKFEIVSEK